MTFRPTAAQGVAQPLPDALRLELARLEARHLLQVAALALWLLAVNGTRTVRRWHSRARQRAHLAELDERLLRDIGLDATSRRPELRKWFWQL